MMALALSASEPLPILGSLLFYSFESLRSGPTDLLRFWGLLMSEADGAYICFTVGARPSNGLMLSSFLRIA